MKSAAIVAVKIIDIDESDTLNPRIADSYSEFLKEVNALKILSENKAKNINHVIEALPVNQAMWMITEYCGGGSVATLVSRLQCYQILSEANLSKDETFCSCRINGKVDHTNTPRSC
jgi:serine/threonine protein kinase